VKVGILCENYFPTLGGEQEHIFNLRRHLEAPRDGSAPVDVRIIVPHVAYDEWLGPPDDAHVIRPAHSIRVYGEGSASQVTLTPAAYGALRRLFARERFDLLHIHAPVDLGLSAWALSTFDGPIVGTIHSYFTHTWKRNLLRPWYRYVIGRMTRVIAVSDAARDAMGRYVRFDSTVIGNGVDCDAFQAGRPLPQFADGLTNILSVARLEPRNGIDLIIDAFAQLAADQPALRLLLAGDGPSRSHYEAQVARLASSIAARIVFLGPVWQQRADLYASAHCYALAARKASFSILMLEALAAGLRVAALPGEGTSQAGEHWSLAEMAAGQSVATYADALRRALLPATPEYRARAQAMARRHDWSEVVPRIRNVYEETLRRSGAR
jgi:phosphatidylinositol alpha-mannosyltransferase